MSISERIVYKGGIVRPKNKGIEIKCTCECDDCKCRYEYSKHREIGKVSFPNQLSITVWNEDKIDEAVKFSEEWKCKNGRKELKTEYFQYE